MRVQIIGDMEGISGIVVWEQVRGGDPMHEEGRRLYTEEINAAVRGAKAAGATEIVVVDGHGAGKGWQFNSLVPDLLDPDCEYVAHHGWTQYTTLLEQGCDAAVLVGMHARAGTPDGVLCHTVSSVRWRNAWFNDELVGEVGINAALCGHFGVPVALVTGDVATCREAQALLGSQLPCVAVKTGLSRFSARNLAPKRARERIERATTEALTDIRTQPYVPGRPTSIAVELAAVDHAEKYHYRSGIDVVEPRKVVSRGADWLEAWNRLWHA